MLEGESFDQIHTRFIIITNGLISLGKYIDNDQKLWKIIRVLPDSWVVKFTTLKELNDEFSLISEKLENPWDGNEIKRRKRALKETRYLT